MDKNIFNNIPISVEHAITREIRDSDEFKPVKEVIETIFDRIKEKIPMVTFDLRSLEYTGFHELYICRPIIRYGKREIIICNFACRKHVNKPIKLDYFTMWYVDMDENGGFPLDGSIWINDDDSEVIRNRLINELVAVFAEFFNTGKIKNSNISKDHILLTE